MRILALDGGGARGLFTAAVLRRLCDAHPTLLDSIDLFAGTSTGGILALGLAAGLTPAKVIEFYLTNLPRIFPRGIQHTLHELTDPKYSNAALGAALLEIFGERSMRDLAKDVCITTYDLVQQTALLLDRDTPIPLRDAALMTSAAPTYFAPFRGCCDGGVAANSPGMAAVEWAIHNRGAALTDISVLALGTGNAKRPPIALGTSPGAIDWLKAGLIDLLIDAPMTLVDNQLGGLLYDRYCRVDGAVICPMDASEGLLERLIMPANLLDLSGAHDWIKAHWN